MSMNTMSSNYASDQLADSIQNQQALGEFDNHPITPYDLTWTTTDRTSIDTYSSLDSDSKTVKNLNQLVKIKDEEIEKLELKVKELEEKLEDATGHKYTNDRMEKILE
jgi:uncharacterized coiled-coil protein SlyX